MLPPSGEKLGCEQFAWQWVRRIGSPPVVCVTQISVTPPPARSDAKAISFPSGEMAGSWLNPASLVNRRNEYILGAGALQRAANHPPNAAATAKMAATQPSRRRAGL